MTHETRNKSITNMVIGILMVIILMLAGCSVMYYNKYREADSMLYITNDSLTTYMNKYGEEYTARNTLVLKAEQLKNYNDSLYKEYVSLKENPIVITKTKIVTRFDTIYAHTDTIGLGTDNVMWKWNAKDSTFYKINGTSTIKYDFSEAMTVINDIAISAGITLDVIDDGKQIKVIAKSDNPYINVSDIQSVMIDPASSPTIKKYIKPKKNNIGPYIGLGFNVSMTPEGFQPGAGLTIGIGYSKGWFQW